MLFHEELIADQEMSFDNAGIPIKQLEPKGTKFGKEFEDDSLVSVQCDNRLILKENLELVWQKANSISGIRKMNLQFKEERRQIRALDNYGQIQSDYWQVCESFL